MANLTRADKLAVVAAHLHVDAWQRRADRARLAQAFERIRRIHIRLGHAVALENSMSGSRPELAECVFVQRCRPGYEQARVGGNVMRELRRREQTCIERRHAHHDGAFRQEANDIVDAIGGQPAHTRPAQ